MRGSAADAIFMLAPMVPAPDVPEPRLVCLMTLKTSARDYSVIFSWSLHMRERKTPKLNFPSRAGRTGVDPGTDRTAMNFRQSQPEIHGSPVSPRDPVQCDK